jgi:hypothetical protein
MADLRIEIETAERLATLLFPCFMRRLPTYRDRQPARIISKTTSDDLCDLPLVVRVRL